jgi:hypothetical protein
MSISVFKVLYHFELAGKQHASGVHQDHIAAAAGDPTTLSAVLVAAGKGAPAGHVLVFESIANSGAGSYLS